MIIANLRTYSKRLLDSIPAHALVVSGLVLALTAGFGLGILAGREAGQRPGIEMGTFATSSPKVPLEAAVRTSLPEVSPVAATGHAEGEVVASKSGTKYYFPWCGTVKRIKEENKVWFASKSEAEKAGYTPGANCKGL